MKALSFAVAKMETEPLRLDLQDVIVSSRDSVHDEDQERQHVPEQRIERHEDEGDPPGPAWRWNVERRHTYPLPLGKFRGVLTSWLGLASRRTHHYLVLFGVPTPDDPGARIRRNASCRSERQPIGRAYGSRASRSKPRKLVKRSSNSINPPCMGGSRRGPKGCTPV